jgi:LVIVD repeat
MAEHVVVVVGSNQPLPEYAQGEFWVIDFSNASTGAPTAVSVPCSSGGVVVDCSGSYAAVGACVGGAVTIYDISNPAKPQSIGSTGLPFSGVCAVSFYGGWVLAAQANGRQVALIDINDLANPQIYLTYFDTLTDVTLFGSNAIICGVSVYNNAFQFVNTTNLSNLDNVAITNVSPNNPDTNSPLVCDFDGTHAVFSEGLGLYAFNVSGGTPTLVGGSASYGSGGVTSVAIAEAGGVSGAPTGGVQLAYTAGGDPNVELQYFEPPVPSGTSWAGSSASLGDANNIYGQPNDAYGGVAKFCRSIWGTSALLATAGVTQTSAGAQEYVVSLFDLSDGGGSIEAMKQGARIPVKLATTLTPNSTLGVTTFFTFPPWFPHPLPPWPWLRSIGLG